MSSFTGSETNYCFNVFETDGMTTSRSKLRPRKLSLQVTKMANYQPTYLGEIELSEESLAHYGVKGMKWRRRKGNLKKTTHDKSRIKDRLAKTGMPEWTGLNG